MTEHMHNRDTNRTVWLAPSTLPSVGNDDFDRIIIVDEIWPLAYLGEESMAAILAEAATRFRRESVDAPILSESESDRWLTDEEYDNAFFGTDEEYDIVNLFDED